MVLSVEWVVRHVWAKKAASLHPLLETLREETRGKRFVTRVRFELTPHY